jgi:hypothetical protein
MMRIFYFLLIILLLTAYTGNGQIRHCHADENLAEEIKNNPRRLEILDQIERHMVEYQRSTSTRSVATVTIPVVVHIVYNDATENISDAQIKSQIDVLNKDFRRKNTDATNTWPQAADTGIEFCLASTDPSGKATNGITRTYTANTSFSTSGDAVKYSVKGGKDAWPTDTYLNIWVCDISGTVLGFGQFPGGNAETDGVVIDYKVFGTGPNVTQGFHLGRTTTHEVGHWLNLKHIWGASDCSTDDLVADTPQASAPNYGCAKGHSSCNSVDMVENYMDYSNDDCMNLFTAGQKARMQSLFSVGGFRYNITKSNGCNVPPPANAYCGKVKIELVFDAYPQETSWTIKSDKGITVLTSPKYLSSQKNTLVVLDTCLQVGCYEFTISDIYSDGMCCKFGNGGYKLYVGGTLTASGGSYGKSASHSFCITSTSVPTCTDGIKNGTETGIDCGGTCTACATCTDGIKNGTETGIDCGGSCQKCPTCTDGIKNGSETGIDCGGSCPPCITNSPPVSNTSGLLSASYFEKGWDNWTGNIIDTERYFGDFSWEGDYSIMIRDNGGEESAMTSAEMDLRGFQTVKIEFAFYAYSMEKDEDFWLMYYDGTKWNTLKSYVSEKDFYNNNFYEVSFIMDATKYNFIQKGRFRFQCDASTNADQIFIDAVKITGTKQGSRISDYNKIVSAGSYIGKYEAAQNFDAEIYPNPTNDYINFKADDEIKEVKIYDLSGKLQSLYTINDDHGRIDVSHLQRGIYLFNLISEEKFITKKLVRE